MKIALLGDTALFGRYSTVRGTCARDYFRDVSRHLEQFDHVVANLETPFAVKHKPRGAKSAYIKSDPRDVELLKYLHIDIVNLANNHCFDYGIAGYDCTISTLEAANIDYFGVEGRAIELEDAGARVALHGYCSYTTNPLGLSRNGAKGVNPLVFPTVVEAMRRFDQNGFLNIVSVHSGWEHVNYPSRQDICMARAMADICPFVYYGHHPHVMQGVEQREGSVVAYSLGNFCFDDVYVDHSSEPLIRQTENNKKGLILELEILENRVASLSMTTIRLGDEAMELNPTGSHEALADYSKALHEPAGVYEARRRALIAAYMADRRSARDFGWFLKRLRPRYAELLIRAKLNALAQHRSVGRHVGVGG